MEVLKSIAYQIPVHLLHLRVPRDKGKRLSPAKRIHLQRIQNILRREARVLAESHF